MTFPVPPTLSVETFDSDFAVAYRASVNIEHTSIGYLDDSGAPARASERENESHVSEHRILNSALESDSTTVEELTFLPGMRILDASQNQLESLVGLLPSPPAEVLDEPQRWIHYPWRHSLVKLLGPRGFRTLRLDRNRNKITLSEQERMTELRVGVVGLSVGHAVAHTLAIEGLCGELRLADFDVLDLSNLNRVPASVFDLDINKTTVAARRIAELDPYLTVVTHPEGLIASSMDTFMDGLDIVIDECDSLDTKLTLREAARSRGIPVLMETSDGGILDVERFDLEPTRPLLHGLLGDIDARSLVDITPEQKAPLAARILDPTKLTPRMLASLPEIGVSLSTWPQLGSDVALGGASVAAVVRAFGLGTPPPSGRVRINLEAHISAIVDF